MATLLAAQLAQIRAHSTNALDLKAQNKAHSRSLLFDERHAANQDFDTLFHFCYDGYQELCRLDTRFADFAGNLFSEQSKQEDRTHMTTVQNQQLDLVLEDFMRLLGNRLLLKPGMKAMEWLIRRFKSFTPETLLLSILPEFMPAALRFLRPYVQTSTELPYQAIVYTAAHNSGFFDILNAHTLRVCRRQQQYPALLSFWSSIISEAVALMLDRSHMGRLQLRQQHQEEIVLRVMPTLAEGLSMHSAPDFRIGCFMVLIVLSSKLQLSEDALAEMMDRVAFRWADVTHAGLICLVILAQRRHTLTLPKRTFRALISLDRLVENIVLLQRHYGVGKLASGIVLGLLRELGKPGDSDRMRYLRLLLEANLMQPDLIASALQPIFRLSWGIDPLPKVEDDRYTESALRGLLLRLTELERAGSTIRLSLESLDPESHQYSIEPLADRLAIAEEADVAMPDVNEVSAVMTFEQAISLTTERRAVVVSLLSCADPDLFSRLSDAFLAAHQSSELLHTFSELVALRKPFAMTEPLYFSFFVRIWCGFYPTTARVAAINMLSNYFRNENPIADVQMLHAYILHALDDASQLVRQAAAELILVLAASYHAVHDDLVQQSELPVLGRGRQLYGQDDETIAWLPWKVTLMFIHDWLVPHLEEFQMEAGRISRYLVDMLVGHKDASKFKTSQRAMILHWLCSQVVVTPMYLVKNWLLPVLMRVPKIGQTCTRTLLTPLLASSLQEGETAIQEACAKEHVDTSQYIGSVMEIVRPKESETLKILRECICSPPDTIGPLFSLAAFRRLHSIWPQMKSQTQVSFGKIMLDLAASDVESGQTNLEQQEALGMLLTTKLSTEVLQSLLQECPRLATQEMTKRRRTLSPRRSSEFIVKRASIVLEAVESSATQANHSILGTLFEVLLDLQAYKEQSGTELHYLELLVMNSVLDILTQSPTTPIQKTDVQQTAMLLVSLLAGIAPELILHNIMPIFTFTNSSILQRADDYSAYVVNQTMNSVIPRVMDSLRKRHKDPMAGVSELLLSFAAAFDHVPSQRLLALFKSLMNLVGADAYLFALIILLQNKIPNNKRVPQFLVDLLDCYQVEVHLKTIERYLATIFDSLRPDPTFSTHLIPSASSNKRLVSRIAQAFTPDRAQIEYLRTIMSDVIDQILSLSRQCQSNNQMVHVCQKLLDIILDGLPMVESTIVLQRLLEIADTQACYDVLRSFEVRLSDRRSEPAATHDACLIFLNSLVAFIRNRGDESTICTAVACIDRIAERFGKKDGLAVIEAMNTVIGRHCLGATNTEMQTKSLLTLSTVVQTLGDESVPLIPQALPKTLGILKDAIDDGNCNERLHNAAFLFFNAILVYIPWAMVGPNLDLLLKVSHGSCNSGLSDACSEQRKATLNFVAKQIEPKDCLCALERTWNNAMGEDPEALKEHLQILEILIARLTKSAVSLHADAFTKLLIKAFDLRRVQYCPRSKDSYEESEVIGVEAASNHVAVSLIYKMNDTIFRPIFMRLVEWAASSSPAVKTQRRTALYNFLVDFFDVLKSIVTNYAALIIEDIMDILKGVDWSDEASRLLWMKVIQTLHKTFIHDQDGFWQSPKHFRPVSEVLLDQLKPAAEAATTSQLIASITELVGAGDSPKHHKTFNAAILHYTRSDVPAVRLAAVQCQQSLTDRLGEEWLALLPEMLPFISELQEDDDGLVERATLRWIEKIEDVLGENLAPMLQ
ncbi:MAG: hypothetical protein LQ352_002655 [Teloschistes flavicans]|nr:MAG: hypothetical protein LQ352_002655 [Teloschistes flavicans]